MEYHNILAIFANLCRTGAINIMLFLLWCMYKIFFVFSEYAEVIFKNKMGMGKKQMEDISILPNISIYYERMRRVISNFY
jgi:hypothetical protein